MKAIQVAPNVCRYAMAEIMGKPRMTRRDKWKKRPVTQRYNAFKDELRLRGVVLPESGYHLIVVLPMPSSWTPKKRLLLNGQPHQQKPDKDNIEKGILDTLFVDDSGVWDGRVSKYWGEDPCIYVKTVDAYATLDEAIQA